MGNDYFQNIAPASNPFTFIKAGKIQISGLTVREATDILAIGFQWNFTQQQVPILIIGSESKILTDVPGEGTINMMYIISNKKVTDIFPAKMFSDGNTGVNITISSVDGNNPVAKTFVNCSITSLGGTINAEAPYMQGNVAIRFSSVQAGASNTLSNTISAAGSAVTNFFNAVTQTGINILNNMK